MKQKTHARIIQENRRSVRRILITVVNFGMMRPKACQGTDFTDLNFRNHLRIMFHAFRDRLKKILQNFEKFYKAFVQNVKSNDDVSWRL